ncbi:MAG: hypothetical protein Q9168_006167, partial [Polycauliona sp. 1 TL-2023]
MTDSETPSMETPQAHSAPFISSDRLQLIQRDKKWILQYRSRGVQETIPTIPNPTQYQPYPASKSSAPALTTEQADQYIESLGDQIRQLNGELLHSSELVSIKNGRFGAHTFLLLLQLSEIPANWVIYASGRRLGISSQSQAVQNVAFITYGPGHLVLIHANLSLKTTTSYDSVHSDPDDPKEHYIQGHFDTPRKLVNAGLISSTGEFPLHNVTCKRFVVQEEDSYGPYIWKQLEVLLGLAAPDFESPDDMRQRLLCRLVEAAMLHSTIFVIASPEKPSGSSPESRPKSDDVKTKIPHGLEMKSLPPSNSSVNLQDQESTTSRKALDTSDRVQTSFQSLASSEAIGTSDRVQTPSYSLDSNEAVPHLPRKGTSSNLLDSNEAVPPSPRKQTAFGFVEDNDRGTSKINEARITVEETETPDQSLSDFARGKDISQRPSHRSFRDVDLGHNVQNHTALHKRKLSEGASSEFRQQRQKVGTQTIAITSRSIIAPPADKENVIAAASRALMTKDSTIFPVEHAGDFRARGPNSPPSLRIRHHHPTCTNIYTMEKLEKFERFLEGDGEPEDTKSVPIGSRPNRLHRSTCKSHGHCQLSHDIT